MKRFFGQLTKASTLSNNIIRGSLQDYTWSELKIIANDLSMRGKSSSYYNQMMDLLQAGDKKTFDTSSTRIGKQASVRIIGILQDEKPNGTRAGLTFQTTHALATSCQMDESIANGGDWSSASMRAWLNNNVYTDFPVELKNSITSVKKYYSLPCYGVDNGSTVDKVYLASMCEIYGRSNNPVDLWLDREGTGENHDEQYAWYAFNNASAVEQDYSCLERMHVDYNGKTPGTYEFWWLRSTYDDASNGFWSVSSDGSPRYNSAGYSCGVVPVFSL